MAKTKLKIKKETKQDTPQITPSTQAKRPTRHVNVFVNAKGVPVKASAKASEAASIDSSKENTEWLLASASTFSFWDNDLDAEYDKDV